MSRIYLGKIFDESGWYLKGLWKDSWLQIRFSSSIPVYCALMVVDRKLKLMFTLYTITRLLKRKYRWKDECIYEDVLLHAWIEFCKAEIYTFDIERKRIFFLIIDAKKRFYLWTCIRWRDEIEMQKGWKYTVQ